jgi:hypothetical protein
MTESEPINKHQIEIQKTKPASSEWNLLLQRSLVNVWKHPMNVKYYSLCIVIYI